MKWFFHFHSGIYLSVPVLLFILIPAAFPLQHSQNTTPPDPAFVSMGTLSSLYSFNNDPSGTLSNPDFFSWEEVLLPGNSFGYLDQDRAFYIKKNLFVLLFLTVLLVAGMSAFWQRKTRNKLRKTAEHLKTTLTSIGDAVIATDSKGRITCINPVAEKLTGWSATEAVGKHIAEVFIIVKADTREPAFNPVARALADGITVGLANHTVLIAKDGSEYQIADSAAPIRDQKGSVTGVVMVFRDVSEEYSIQAKLRFNEDRLRKTLLAANDGMWDWNLLSGEVYFDPRYYQMAGYEVDEFAYRLDEFQNRVHPDDVERVMENAQQHLQGVLDRFHVEFRFRKKDGSWMWILGRGVIVERDQNGTPLRFIGTHTDISERKQIELQLIQNADFNTALLNAIPTPVFFKDREGRYQGCNRAFTEIMGVTPEDLRGKTVSQLWPSEHAEVYHKKDIELMENPQHQVYEFKIRDKDGTLRPVIYAKDVFRDHAGEIAGLVGAFLDISEQEHAKEELRSLQNYLANIIDSMPSMLVGVDPEGTITQWNAEAQRQTGIPVEEAVGRPMERIIPQFADELDRIKSAIRNRQMQTDLKRRTRQGNETRYQDVTVYPLIANGVEGAVVRVDDVTERVQLEEMMVQSEKMLSVGGLAAGMAHEINNPLGGMIQTASVMKDRLIDRTMEANLKAAGEAGISLDAIAVYMEKRKIIEMVDRIRKSGSRAAEIVQNMLSFARKSDSTRSSHNLAELLDQSVDLAGSDYDLKKKYDFRKIEIIRKYDEPLPLVPCEAGKIQQVFLNILRNGAEAMHEKKEDLNQNEAYSPRFSLRLAREESAGRIRIEIEDNGPGMDKETLKRVFDPFFTTKPTDRGTGLGLSVSYFIITENHGGEMSVVSNPGEGTTFMMRLPVKDGRNG